MKRLLLLSVFALAGSWMPDLTAAQVVVDTTFTWQGYAQTAECRLRIYAAPADAGRRHTVILQELASNRGPTTAFDLPYLAEAVSRRFELDPAETYWILHWGAFSYEGARPTPGKELFLRATFRRTKSRNLGAPSWKLVTRDDVRAYTDRHFD